MYGIKYKPIGIIHSPFRKPKGIPIQPTAAKGIDGNVAVFSEYAEGFSHIILIFNFHLSRKLSLKVKPFMDKQMRGIFATRAPSRPNPTGILIVRLVKNEEKILHVQDVDIIDGTPVLDIKPYVCEFDAKEVDKIGWLEKNVYKLPTSNGNGRFIK